MSIVNQMIGNKNIDQAFIQPLNEIKQLILTNMINNLNNQNKNL